MIKRLIMLGARIALVVLCLVYAFWGVDLPRFVEILGRSYGFVALLGVSLAVFLVYLVPAWRLIRLVASPLSFTVSFNSQVFAIGLNNVLPAKLGEVAKALYLRNKSGLSTAEGVAAVFWERFLDLNGVLILGGVVIWLSGRTFAMVPLLGAVAFGWFLLYINHRHPRMFRAMAAWLPWPRLRKLIHEVLEHLALPPRIMFLPEMLGYTLLGWLVYAILFYVVLNTLAGFGLQASQLLTVFVVASLGMAVPSSPGSLGVYEAVVVMALGWFGVDKEQAVAAAVFLHLVQLLPTTLYALLLLNLSKISLRRLHAREGEPSQVAP